MQFRSVLLIAAASITALAQNTPNLPSSQEINKMNANSVCQIYFERPKPGDIAGFEQSRKEHFQFHKSKGDTWTWNVYEVITGDNTGMYVVSTCGHSWKDLDAWEQKMGDADTQNANQVMGPHLMDNKSGVYTVRADISMQPADAPPAKFVTVTVYRIHPGTGDQFVSWISRLNALVRNEPSRQKNTTWMELINGGAGPTFVLVQNRKGWADVAPPEKSNKDLAVAAWGQEQYDSQYKQFVQTIGSIYTEAAVYRPDLSYNPK